MKLSPKEISVYKITKGIRLYVTYNTYSIGDLPERIKIQNKCKDTWWYESEFNVII